jgi:hypothetical protein
LCLDKFFYGAGGMIYLRGNETELCIGNDAPKDRVHRMRIINLNMKLNSFVFYLSLVFTLLFLMPSCSSDDYPFILEKNQQNAIEKGLDFSYEESSQTVSFNVKNNTDWSSSIMVGASNATPDWCSITNDEHGGTQSIHVDCKKNDSETQRSAVIVIQSNGHTLNVSVRQAGKPTLHLFSQTEYTISKDGGEISIPFTYNTSFDTGITCYAADSHYHWIDLVKVDTANAKGTLSYRLWPNSGLGRVSMIVFSKNGLTLGKVIIKQKPNDEMLTQKLTISTLTNSTDSIASIGLLGVILGEDNVEGWKKVKHLQIVGDLYYKDLLFLKKFAGAGDIQNRLDMAGSHKVLDLNCVETIYSEDLANGYSGWRENGKNILPDRLFESSTALDSVLLPLTLHGIGNYTFDGCSSLIYAEVPYSVKSVGSHAFFNCPNLVTLKTWRTNDLQSIGQMAFSTGGEFGSFYLSEELKDFDIYSFQGFHPKKLYAPWDDADLIPSILFQSTLYQNCTLVVPKGCAALYRNAGNWGKFENVLEE